MFLHFSKNSILEKSIQYERLMREIGSKRNTFTVKICHLLW